MFYWHELLLIHIVLGAHLYRDDSGKGCPSRVTWSNCLWVTRLHPRSSWSNHCTPNIVGIALNIFFKATYSPRNLIPLPVCPAPLKDQSNWLPQWTLLWSLCYSNTRIWYSKCVKPGMNWSMTWTQGCHHSQAIPGFIHCALGSTPSLSGKMPWGLGPLQP